MSLFSFKKETRIYIVYQGIQYGFDISEITFSQTIAEESVSSKTLQLQNLFEASKIYKANPANFEFTFPALRERDLRVAFNRLLDCYTFDLYIETNQDLFSITNCVVTSGTFNFNDKRPLALTIAGQGSKLTRVGNFGSVIPGTIDTRSGTRTYNKINYINISIDNGPFLDYITGVSIEVTNGISWRPNSIIEGCEDNTILTYPEEFILEKKAVAGNFSTHEISDFSIEKDIPLRIRVGELVGSTLYGFDFNLDKVVIASRIATPAIFTHVYDWRLTEDPNSLLEAIQYITYDAGTASAILDYLGAPILDAWNDPILESV